MPETMSCLRFAQPGHRSYRFFPLTTTTRYRAAPTICHRWFTAGQDDAQHESMRQGADEGE